MGIGLHEIHLCILVYLLIFAYRTFRLSIQTDFEISFVIINVKLKMISCHYSLTMVTTVRVDFKVLTLPNKTVVLDVMRLMI